MFPPEEPFWPKKDDLLRDPGWAYWDIRPDDRFYVARQDGRMMLHQGNGCCDEVCGKVGNVLILGPIPTLELAVQQAGHWTDNPDVSTQGERLRRRH